MYANTIAFLLTFAILALAAAYVLLSDLPSAARLLELACHYGNDKASDIFALRCEYVISPISRGR